MTDEEVEQLIAELPKYSPTWKGQPQFTKLECAPGWHRLIAQTHLQLKNIDPNYKIHQIKEKFGGLRYYAQSSLPFNGDWRDNPFGKVIRRAEAKSYHICEETGKSDAIPMIKKDGFWQRTLDKEWGEAHGFMPMKNEGE